MHDSFHISYMEEMSTGHPKKGGKRMSQKRKFLVLARPRDTSRKLERSIYLMSCRDFWLNIPAIIFQLRKFIPCKT